MKNPFEFGDLLSPELFINRDREIREIVDRIIARGQSSSVVGEPRMGKSSLLYLLKDPQKYSSLYQEANFKLYFQYLDAQPLGNSFTQSSFWEYGIQPLIKEGVFIRKSSLKRLLSECRKNGFGNFVLERLLAQLETHSIRLVLLLDEFDALLFNPILNRTEFLGGLRTLASRYQSLTLITASRQSLSQLNQTTQELSRTGSPFFNIFKEIVLGRFDELHIQELLARADEKFSSADRSYLTRLAGGHPFLLQAGASLLWHTYDIGITTSKMRWQKVGDELFSVATTTLSDTWRLWSPEMKKVFAIIALDETPFLLGEDKMIDIGALLNTLPDYAPEIRDLRKRGFIYEDSRLRSKFCIGSEVMLWWLVNELIQALRANDNLGSWLREQKWDGYFKSGEKAILIKTAVGLSNILKGGVESFVKAASEGFGKGISGTV